MGLKNTVTCTKLVGRNQHQSVCQATEKQVESLFGKKATVINTLLLIHRQCGALLLKKWRQSQNSGNKY